MERGTGVSVKALRLRSEHSCPLRNKREQNEIWAADWEVRNSGVPDDVELGRRQPVVTW